MKCKELKDFYESAEEDGLKFRTWAEYSNNYIVAISSNGHRVSASKSASGFSSRFELFNKQNVLKKSKLLERA